MEELRELFDFLYEKRQAIGEKTLEHLVLTGISVALAVGIGVVLGVTMTRRQQLARPVLGVANVIQTIPSVALLGFMIPLIGIGPTPAIVALFLYALLPVIRNTYTGIQNVDLAVKEAGKGMGMTDWQLLTRVELPLALPVLFAGIRTAAVINVGVATLCALIAAGGLGEFIFTGIALNNSYLILSGAIPAALLAIVLDTGLGLIQQKITQWARPLLILLLLCIAAIFLYRLWSASAERNFTAGLTSEFMERRDGWQGLKDAYGLKMDAVQMDAGLMYSAVKNDKVDVIGGYSTDGRIDAYDLRILDDDRHFFPPYYVAPLVRMETLERYPEIRGALDKLAGKVSDERMRRLNYLVDHEQRAPRAVARAFLQELGLRTDVQRNGRADIAIGGKNFTEQYILARMFAILIENYTSLDVELKTGLGGTKICFDALRTGDIDLYPEYTGTGFLVLLQPDASEADSLIRDKDKVFRYVRSNFRDDYGLEWLEPLGFNNTYALMMQRSRAESLNVRSISDLVAYLKQKQ